MARPRLVPLATLVAIAGAAACGSLVGSGGAVADAPGDGGTADGSRTTDDASATDGGSLSGCTHMFCADFEGPSLYGFDDAKPTTPFEDGGWSVSSTLAVSGTHSMRTLVYPGQAAHLGRTLGSNLKHVTVDLRLRYERFEYVSGKSNPLTIHCDTGGDVALIKASDTKLQVSAGGADNDVSARTSGAWHRLRLDFDIPTRKIVLTELTETGAEASSSSIDASSGCSGATSLVIGDDPASGGGTYEGYIDDVLADWQ